MEAYNWNFGQVLKIAQYPHEIKRFEQGIRGRWTDLEKNFQMVIEDGHWHEDESVPVIRFELKPIRSITNGRYFVLELACYQDQGQVVLVVTDHGFDPHSPWSMSTMEDFIRLAKSDPYVLKLARRLIKEAK